MITLLIIGIFISVLLVCIGCLLGRYWEFNSIESGLTCLRASWENQMTEYHRQILALEEENRLGPANEMRLKAKRLAGCLSDFDAIARRYFGF